MAQDFERSCEQLHRSLRLISPRPLTSRFEPGSNPFPVILYGQHNVAAVYCETDGYVRGLRVFQGVVQRFLKSQKQAGSHGAGQIFRHRLDLKGDGHTRKCREIIQLPFRTWPSDQGLRHSPDVIHARAGSCFPRAA